MHRSLGAAVRKGRAMYDRRSLVAAAAAAHLDVRRRVFSSQVVDAAFVVTSHAALTLGAGALTPLRWDKSSPTPYMIDGMTMADDAVGGIVATHAGRYHIEIAYAFLAVQDQDLLELYTRRWPAGSVVADEVVVWRFEYVSLPPGSHNPGAAHSRLVDLSAGDRIDVLARCSRACSFLGSFWGALVPRMVAL